MSGDSGVVTQDMLNVNAFPRTSVAQAEETLVGGSWHHVVIGVLGHVIQVRGTVAEPGIFVTQSSLW